jgi:hypothetical protein
MKPDLELISAPALSLMKQKKSNWQEHTWTGSELREKFQGHQTLKELLIATQSYVEELGEVVCEYEVNGITLTESEETRFSETLADEVTTFCVRSERPLKLLDDSIEGCTQYIDKILETLDRASNLFRLGDVKGAHECHTRCIEAAEIFVEMITHYKIAYQTLKGGLSANWTKLEQDMLATLTQIFDEYSKKNFILVADLLEYDLSNIFTAWKLELASLDHSTESSVHR